MKSITTYHGSTHQFEQFTFDHMRANGTDYGAGFYTTTNREYACRYARGAEGYLYTYTFYPIKALSLTEREIQDEELAELLWQLHEDIGILWNYAEVDYVGVDQALVQAIDIETNYTENDVDLINGIIQSCGDTEAVLRALYEILGYTHVEVLEGGEKGDFYIAFTPDCLTLTKRELMTEEGR